MGEGNIVVPEGQGLFSNATMEDSDVEQIPWRIAKATGVHLPSAETLSLPYMALAVLKVHRGAWGTT